MKRLLILLALLPTLLMGQEVIKIGDIDTIEYSGTLPSVIQVGKVYVSADNVPEGYALYAQKIGDTIRLSSNFDTTKDLWIDFLPLAPNYLYNLINIAFHTDVNSTADYDLTGSKTIYKTNTTDVIGPYSIRYDGIGTYFVGGSHGHLTYNLSGGNDLPTAAPSIPVINGNSINGIYYSNDSLQVSWNNYIFNYTSIQDLGVSNGDTIIRENILVTLYPSHIKVRNTIYVDSAEITTYYGHQWSNGDNKYNDSILYLRGEAYDWEAFENSTSGRGDTVDHYLGWVAIADDVSHRVFGYIDNTVGLGTGSDVNWTTYNKSFASTTKTYANLIKYASGENVYENDTLTWEGGYVFTPDNDSITYSKDDKDYFITYFNSNKTDTFYIGEDTKMLKMISKDGVLKLNNDYPYIITSSGNGVLKTEVINRQLPFTADSLIASYDFNYGITLSGDTITGIADQSGNGNNLSAVGKPLLIDLSDTASIYFDGDDDNLRIARAATDDFNPDAGSWSIDFSIKILEKTFARLVGYYRSSSTPFWSVTMGTDGEPILSIRDNSGNTASNDMLTDIADGEWHHLAFVVNMSTDSIYAYVDKIEVNRTTCATITTVAATLTDAYFGLNSGLQNQYKLKHCNFYKEALTPEEITILYNYYMQ